MDLAGRLAFSMQARLRLGNDAGINTRMRRRGLTLSTLLVAIFLIGATVAHAETEPNDNLLQANGPIAPGETVSGELQTTQDVDWYWLQLGGQQQITFSSSIVNPAECSYGTLVELVNYWGREEGVLRPRGEAYGSKPQPVEDRISTPVGGGTYYVRVRSEDVAGCQYSFSVTPATAYAPPPLALPQFVVPEPNEFKWQAFGPLEAGKLYTGTIETSNDKDWLYYEVLPESAATVVMTVARCGDEGGSIHPQSGDEGAVGFVGGELEGHSAKTVKTGRFQTRYNLEITGNVGCLWQIEVSPGTALAGSVSTSHHPNPCVVAKRLLGRRRIHLHRAERSLPFVHNAAARKRLQHKIAVRRKTIRAARKEVEKLC